jgi:transcription antitermination factor NusG
MQSESKDKIKAPTTKIQASIAPICIPKSANPKAKNWYILKTKSNCEKKVFQNLSEEGYDAYLPTYTTLRVWSDRKKKVEIPLLPSYVFIQCVPAELISAAQTKGVAWIVRDLNLYAIVKDYEIENLRIFLSETHEALQESLDDFQEGQAVHVTHGPFKGLKGIALQSQSDYRVKIEISALATNFTVNVPKNQLQPILLDGV